MAFTYQFVRIRQVCYKRKVNLLSIHLICNWRSTFAITLKNCDKCVDGANRLCFYLDLKQVFFGMV